MSSKFDVGVAEYVLNGDAQKLPAVAEQGLQEGLDTPSLRILAGLDENANPFELEDYLHRSLRELNYSILSKKQAINTGLEYYARQIKEGSIDPIEGARIISDEYLEKIDENMFGQVKKYAYDNVSIHMAAIYGDYDSYCDYRDLYPNGTDSDDVYKTKQHIVREAEKYVTEVQA